MTDYADLKSAASQARPAVAVMPALEAEQQQMLDTLRSANGAEFDRAFVEQQKQAHQRALTTLQQYAQQGDYEAAREAASNAEYATSDADWRALRGACQAH